MNKEEWLRLYTILDGIHSDFLMEYGNYKSGRNQKIRDKAERDIENAIRRADFHITNSEEVYELLTGETGTTAYSRALVYDEFTKSRYFGTDLSAFLVKIQTKIRSFDE